MEKSFINYAPNGVTFPVVTKHQASDTVSSQHKGQHGGKGGGIGGRKGWCSYQVTQLKMRPLLSYRHLKFFW